MVGPHRQKGRQDMSSLHALPPSLAGTPWKCLSGKQLIQTLVNYRYRRQLCVTNAGFGCSAVRPTLHLIVACGDIPLTPGLPPALPPFTLPPLNSRPPRPHTPTIHFILNMCSTLNGSCPYPRHPLTNRQVRCPSQVLSRSRPLPASRGQGMIAAAMGRVAPPTSAPLLTLLSLCIASLEEAAKRETAPLYFSELPVLWFTIFKVLCSLPF